MTVRCLIGTGSSELVLYLSAVLEKFTDRGTVTVMPDCRELLRELRPCAGRVILFADRYYFGFHIENQVFRILSREPKTQIVILGEPEFEKTFAFRMHNAGVFALVDHVLTGGDTEERIGRVMEGRRVLPEAVAGSIADGEHLNYKDCYNAPTVKEYKLLSMVSYGMGHKQICGEFGMSESMLGTYMERVRRRLGARTTAEAVRIWWQTKASSNLEDDEYDGVCGWNVQQGMFFERGGAGEIPKRKQPERRTGVQCRRLQERALGVRGGGR